MSESFQFTIESMNSTSYYLVVKGYSIYDTDLAKLLGMKMGIYRQHLRRKFHGVQYYEREDIFFKTQTDARQAADWANGFLMTRVLRGENLIE